jgi:hypothetical protein
MRTTSYLCIAGATLIPLIVSACFNPQTGTCKVHCWEDRPEPVDANSNGRFDGQCTNFYPNPSAFFPPIKTVGFYLGKACTDTQGEHDAIKGAIARIKAEEALPMGQLDAYESIVNQIVDDAWEACRTHLIGNDDGDGDFDDIDPNTTGNQACTPITAEALCDTYIKGPALAALLELEDCGIRQPQYSSPESNNNNCVFEPEFDATESVGETEMCAELPTTGEEIATFGAFPTLVSCNSPSNCQVDEEIVYAVQTNFSQFYDDGVVLTLQTTCPAGAKITGLNTGEVSFNLANKFGIQNNDIITHVNGVPMNSDPNVSSVLAWLAEGQDQVQVKRWRGTCTGGSNTTYNIIVTN